MTGPAHGTDAPGGVTVRGSGAADAVPDVVLADLATEVRDRDVAVALRDATTALAAVRAALRAAGVDDRAVRTGDVATWTEQDGPDGDLRVVARMGVVVTLRDTATAGDVVGAALAAGGPAVRLGGLRLVVADPAPAHALAREAAWQDAHEKATHLAALAGRPLGDVRWVHEGDPAGGEVPRFARALGADAFALPVDPGEQSVRATVTVRWDWGDGT
ncbi:SIMPL domain-containing protein [Cellulomonas iranensis]|uniref:Uncharacterized protein YggE n=1 Tax=Cellulomonas iranensis TaxID=76862 RepID=A0ABU0GGK7_9CELL|nr:SIMPL domain-containing protein [Cellulomonas iranensis]MDQ0424481.1 uncharacterized protein YggE [Cellulomonas iranensis]